MSVNSSLDPPLYQCTNSRGAFITFTAFIFTKAILVHPLSVFILYLGLQQRLRHSFKTASHSDYFTYNMAALELSTEVAYVVFFCGSFTGHQKIEHLAFIVSNAVFPGQMLFHIVTCVERYLAVVHPVTYLSLRRSGGVRIRNICISCVWLLSFSWSGITALFTPSLLIIPFFCLLLLSWFVTSLCSVAVLCVLIRPGPGEVGRDKEQVNESKQRAFYTVAVILAVLWLWFVGLSVCIALDASQLFSHSVGCLLLTVGFWFSFPGSLVLPMLFLHRAEKLRCCKQITESG